MTAGWRVLARRAKRGINRLRGRTDPTFETYLSRELPHEPLLRQLFPGLSAKVVLDIGACEGEDSIRYSRMFPQARIFACEPLPKNLALLSTNLERFATDRVVVVPRAISDSRGTATFHVSSGRPQDAGNGDWDYGNKSSSLLPPDKTEEVHTWLKFDEEIEIATWTIADLMVEHDLEMVDFVHMDIQGAELMALKGAGTRLDDIKSIWLEVEAVTLYADQPLKADIEHFMQVHGFRKVLDTVEDVAGDQFYVNSRFFDTESLLARPDS
jgi:FkbM family methyltransferase